MSPYCAGGEAGSGCPRGPWDQEKQIGRKAGEHHSGKGQGMSQGTGNVYYSV